MIQRRVLGSHGNSVALCLRGNQISPSGDTRLHLPRGLFQVQATVSAEKSSDPHPPPGQEHRRPLPLVHRRQPPLPTRRPPPATATAAPRYQPDHFQNPGALGRKTMTTAGIWTRWKHERKKIQILLFKNLKTHPQYLAAS